MNSNKERFLSLVSEKDTTLAAKLAERKRNREVLKMSARIALLILEKLDELGWTQKDLAEKMAVSPQQINKIVKGQQNLTLDTMLRLETILDIRIFVVDKMVEQNKTWTNAKSSYKPIQHSYTSNVYLGIDDSNEFNTKPLIINIPETIVSASAYNNTGS